MKLLILTQKVDEKDDVLGFFHGWIKSFSQKFDSLMVICLFQGTYSLPSNVQVFSLGKEHISAGKSFFAQVKNKISYMSRFFRLIFQHRQKYDAIFVHMNPVYVVLGFPFWKLTKKPVYLWYNHHQADIFGKIAFRLVKKLFHTSPFAYSSRYPQSQKMPAGVDTDVFSRTVETRKKNSILYVGRISPIKSVDVLIEAAQMLHHKGIDFSLSIVGKPDPEAGEYYKKLQTLSEDLIALGKVNFLGSIPNKDMSILYNTHEILINLSPAGLYDKTVPEAMACESLVLASSPAFKDVIGEKFLFQEKDAASLAQKIEECFSFSEERKNTEGRILRNFVEQHESLRLLTDRFSSLTHK